jgi:hypothetical protein
MSDSPYTEDEHTDEKTKSFISYLGDVDSEALKLVKKFMADIQSPYQQFFASAPERTEDVVKRILADEEVPQNARELVASRLLLRYVPHPCMCSDPAHASWSLAT